MVNRLMVFTPLAGHHLGEGSGGAVRADRPPSFDSDPPLQGGEGGPIRHRSVMPPPSDRFCGKRGRGGVRSPSLGQGGGVVQPSCPLPPPLPPWGKGVPRGAPGAPVLHAVGAPHEGRAPEVRERHRPAHPLQAAAWAAGGTRTGPHGIPSPTTTPIAETPSREASPLDTPPSACLSPSHTVCPVRRSTPSSRQGLHIFSLENTGLFFSPR